jgi:hypothetical protein
MCDISGSDAAQCAAAEQEVKNIVLDGRERDGGGDGGGMPAGLNHNRRPPQVDGRTAAAATHCAAVAAARPTASPIITTFADHPSPAAAATTESGPVRVRVRSLPPAADAAKVAAFLSVAPTAVKIITRGGAGPEAVVAMPSKIAALDALQLHETKLMGRFVQVVEAGAYTRTDFSST